MMKCFLSAVVSLAPWLLGMYIMLKETSNVEKTVSERIGFPAVYRHPSLPPSKSDSLTGHGCLLGTWQTQP